MDKHRPFPFEPLLRRGFFISQNISLLLIFSLPRVKREEIINTQKPITAVQKMGVTAEGSSMNDERKNRAGLPGKKVIGFFVLRRGEKVRGSVEGMPCLR